jgi:hypothetical protein
MAIRTALLYRKNLATLIDESVSLPSSLFPNLTAAPGNSQPSGVDSDVHDCCESSTHISFPADLFGLRVLGTLQVPQMLASIL